MSYPVLVTLHLFAAILFIGTVFFEVVLIEGIRRKVRRESIREVELAIGRRARRIMPWVLLVLFGSGLGMALTRYREALSDPLASPFGTLLSVKIVLALSVLAHFLTAMYILLTGRMNSVYFRRFHLSVFTHMAGIILLAKGMFFISW